jgi:phosphoesterase RecJ-like protein
MNPSIEDNITGLQGFLDSGSGSEIVITTHHKPDADALGSSLGLYHFLKAKGKTVTVITPTDYPHFLHWMPGNDSVINFEESPGLAKMRLDAADVVFCLDFNDLKRINELGDLVEASGAIKIMIDHHRDPKGFDDYRFYTIHTSSTCELIYEYILRCDGEELINKDIAECLYSGIIADTGSFRFSSTSRRTHEIAAALIDQGIVAHEIHSRLFDEFSLGRYKLMGYVLYEKLEVIEELHTALIYLTAEELKRFNVQTGDTEGFVNFGLGIQGVKFSVLIIDRTKLIKMSFRSQGTFPCNEFAAKHFRGGGHLNASGGSSDETLEEVVNRFRKVLPEYKELLNNV